MKDNSLLTIILFFILGSVIISGIDFLSYAFKSLFYTISFVVLIVIGLLSLYNYLKE